ncbi:MAG: hypothetical protein ABSF43_00950 [Rectinemataceae bacterium]
MRLGRSAALTALAALAMALVTSIAEAQDLRDAQGGAATVARALLEEARQTAGVGDWEDASLYLAEAATHDPGDADILYLRALAAVKGGLPLDEALGNLNGALTTGRFSYYTRHDASTLKAEILVRERRWTEALGALNPPEIDSAVDPVYHLIRARALAGLGDRRAFTAELSYALRRFPDDPAFPRLFLARAGTVPDSAEARELGNIILSRLTRYSAVDPELPVLASPLMGDINKKRDAVTAFRVAGGSSAAATLRALEYGLIDEASASAELLSSAHPVAYGDLVSLFALAGSPAGRNEVFDALADWSGTIEEDSDGDGIAEATFSIAKGLVTGWKLDSRQDGTIDSRAIFADGLPILITLDRTGIQIEIAYSTYPAVSSVAFTEKGERRGYSFGPEAFSFSPIAMRLFAGTGKTAMFFPFPTSAPDPKDGACAAAALSVAVETGSSRSVTLLEKGIPQSSTEYRDGRLFSTTTYIRGKPALERIDADGDGRFETERIFSLDAEGVATPSWQRTDSDGDGVFEYREQLVFPFRKEWDYDGNGSIDALQLQLADGSIKKEFSSRLDGRLDEAVVVKNGKIISLSRDGVSLPLLPDANPQLTWIGKKSFDLGRNLPAGEGIFSAMGKRYRLTRVGEFAFAELVP